MGRDLGPLLLRVVEQQQPLDELYAAVVAAVHEGLLRQRELALLQAHLGDEHVGWVSRAGEQVGLQGECMGLRQPLCRRTSASSRHSRGWGLASMKEEASPRVGRSSSSRVSRSALVSNLSTYSLERSSGSFMI